jgi:hypothetical protein
MEAAVRPSRIGEGSTRYPLTSQQKDPDHTERHSKLVIPTAWRVKGELRIDALRGAFDDVVERHESLRTRISYGDTDGSFDYQEVLPPLPVPFAVQGLPVAPGRSREELARDLYVRVNEERLDFSVTPSLRANLYRFDGQDAVLTFLTHHLYSDNWSIGVLRRELAACYNARVNGLQPALESPAQYREYSTWQRGFLQSDKAAAARRYWRDTLSGAEMFTLPADRPRDAGAFTARSAVKTFLIDSHDAARVTASATENRCTAWHLFLAASMVLAEAARGSTDITLLTVNNGRNVKHFHGTIGFFADLIPLRLEFGGCRSFRELMVLARSTTLTAHRNAIPFREILELVPDLMRTFASPQAMPFAFNYVRPSAAVADIQFADRVEPIAPPDGVPAMFHRGACTWDVEMLPSGAFRCVVEYEPSMVDADTIDNWGFEFVTAILAIADEPDRAWQRR